MFSWNNYVVKFIYEKEEPKNFKAVYEKVYVDAYNKYCGFVNSNIERLNKEFEDQYGDDNWTSNTYTEFLRTEFNKYADKVYWSTIRYSLWFKRFLVGDELQFVAVLPNGTQMMFCLKER